MTKTELIEQIQIKRSFLCVGLDPDLKKIPRFLLKSEDPIFEFNKAIIDATKDYCVAYKPNIAFYECLGPSGWESLKKTFDYIPKNIFTIADAKRGDIGNTSKHYAETFFSFLNANSITVSPYMGEDSVKPFLEYKRKWVILLALTSNKGSLDFQFIKDSNNQELYKSILEKSLKWGTDENIMYVVGATRSENIAEVRKLAPKNFFLVPGLGSQGGSLNDIINYGWNDECGLLINSSRGIIYASNKNDFAEKAGLIAKSIQNRMSKILDEKNF
ncbi:MAG: orotidine-5'-phosphate decarboxylase [Crocinitomicaceae bacterium]|nr:orotidine-5'-phosphate decarboxylase [Crocinitomicaceae bacterium]